MASHRWALRFCPPGAVLAVLVGKVLVREGELSIDGATLTCRRGRRTSVIELGGAEVSFGRWEHARSGARGSFVAVEQGGQRLRIGAELLLLPDVRNSAAGTASIDGWIDPADFEALRAAIERATGRADEPRRRLLEAAMTRTLALRPNPFRFGRKGKPGSLEVEGFELRFELGDGTKLTLDARYATCELHAHRPSGRASLQMCALHVHPPVSGGPVTIGTDDLRIGWKADADAPQTGAPRWMIGAAEWRTLLEAVGLESAMEMKR
jgi:hypothetical protein